MFGAGAEFAKEGRAGICSMSSSVTGCNRRVWKTPPRSSGMRSAHMSLWIFASVSSIFVYFVFLNILNKRNAHYLLFYLLIVSCF